MKTYKEFTKQLNEAVQSANRNLEKAAKIAAETKGEHVFADEHDFYHALGLPDDFGVHKEEHQEYKDLWQSVVDETDKDKVLDILQKHFNK